MKVESGGVCETAGGQASFKNDVLKHFGFLRNKKEEKDEQSKNMIKTLIQSSIIVHQVITCLFFLKYRDKYHNMDFLLRYYHCVIRFRFCYIPRIKSLVHLSGFALFVGRPAR